MSTYAHDLANSVAISTALEPAVRTADIEGPAVDLIGSDGECFAVQQVGSVSGSGATWSGSIQESADASAWFAISGATFTPVTASNNTQTIRFTRTQRYVRYAATIAGSSPSIAASAIIGEQKKTF